MELVFSDEFNVEGRTFYPGDDPYWEASDLWYGVTADLEWYVAVVCWLRYRILIKLNSFFCGKRYDPSAITTKDGVSLYFSYCSIGFDVYTLLASPNNNEQEGYP